MRTLRLFKKTVTKISSYWEPKPQPPSFYDNLPCRNVIFTSLYVLFAPTATTVPWFSPGRLTDVFTPLWGVWESLRWVLPCQRPLLRLGWHRVLQILPYCQEVGACACQTNICPLFILGLFAELACFLWVASCLCVNAVTHRHTWELSVHLQLALNASLKAISICSLVALASDLHWPIIKCSNSKGMNRIQTKACKRYLKSEWHKILSLNPDSSQRYNQNRCCNFCL